MKGHVDQSLRALIDVSVSASRVGARHSLQVWIDTAFNGGLVIPREQIEQLGLKQGSTTQAILADGKTVDLETFTCYLDWFGLVHRTQVLANDGHTPLLGTMLLDQRQLSIDYAQRTLALS